jgi:purine-binding chemotaxis protein CheW
VHVLKIREIVRAQNWISVAGMPSCLRGVVDLRGKSIPVIDLRAKSSVPPQAPCCIIITQCVSYTRESIEIGLIVDAIEQITLLEARDEVTKGHSADSKAETDSAKLTNAIRAWLRMTRHIDIALAGHN